jgi:hypothetical protein
MSIHVSKCKIYLKKEVKKNKYKKHLDAHFNSMKTKHGAIHRKLRSLKTIT